MSRTTALVFFAAFLVLTAPVVGVAADEMMYREVAYPGVTVAGRDVGGLDERELTALLGEVSEDIGDHSVIVRAGREEYDFTASEVGVRVAVQATAAEVLEVGRGSDWARRIRDRVSARLDGVPVGPTLEVDEGAFTAWADEIALATETLAEDAALVLTPDGPKATAGEMGRALDRDALRELAVKITSTGDGAFEAPLVDVPPRVTTEDALLAVDAAKTAFTAPVTFGHREHRFRLSGEELASLARVKGSGTGAQPLTFDTENGRIVLEELLAPVERAPLDATLQPDGQGGFRVVAGEEGLEIDWEALFRELDRAAVDAANRYVPVPTKAAEPKLTTLDATRLGIREGVASFTTYFSSSNEARANNIRQVAEILDGTFVQPGDIFSFNETVGPRTKAAGFDEAPVIVGGVLTPGVGGGICQASTTLFNAVFLAGLPVIERQPHSFFIDHYPVGRDATVSYGTVDLTFRNDSDQSLYISVDATDRSVTVAIGAKRWDRVVEYETGRPTDIVEPRTSWENPRRLRDPELSPGKTAPVEAGVAGRTVEVSRKVLSKDGALLFEDEFRSVYRPKDYIQRLGS